MLPLLAIGTAIGAASSIVNAVSWISRQISDPKPAEAAASKAGAKAPSADKPDFAAALSAKSAGQQMPPAANGPAITSPSIRQTGPSLPSLSETKADIHARIQASLTAYRHLGEHRPGGTHPHAVS
jgi:hypothetical protein